MLEISLATLVALLVPRTTIADERPHTEVIEETNYTPMTAPKLAWEQPLALKQLDTHTERAKRLTMHYGAKYKVSYKDMYEVIKCETGGTFDPTIQSQVRYSFTDPDRGIVEGEREESYGIAQIHLKDNPDISIEQATDMDFSIRFMAEEFSKGNQSWRWKLCWNRVQQSR